MEFDLTGLGKARFQICTHSLARGDDRKSLHKTVQKLLTI